VFQVRNKIPLNKPQAEPDAFQNLILRRHSKRSLLKLSPAKLSKLLWLTSKIISIDIDNEGVVSSHRPSPSAGGLHPIDLIVYTEFRRTKSLFYYNPVDHTLNELNYKIATLNSFINHVNKILPFGDATIIWFVANHYKTAAKYHRSQSLVWRDAGAYIYCFQLVAEALRINSCPLGTLGNPYIRKLLGGHRSLSGTGGMIIGG
jgi:SagB-type dehydrogenase family enzyme